MGGSKSRCNGKVSKSAPVSRIQTPPLAVSLASSDDKLRRMDHVLVMLDMLEMHMVDDSGAGPITMGLTVSAGDKR